MACTCGSKEFVARQIQRCDVIIDEDNNWIRNRECYDSDISFGPFTCNKCGQEYKELPKGK